MQTTYEKISDTQVKVTSTTITTTIVDINDLAEQQKFVQQKKQKDMLNSDSQIAAQQAIIDGAAGVGVIPKPVSPIINPV